MKDRCMNVNIFSEVIIKILIATLFIDLIGFGSALSSIEGVNPDENFSIILFPDTQKEIRYMPIIWESMPKWVVDNKETMNIQAVIGLGDVTDTSTDSEFSEAATGWNFIKDAGIIYVPVPGNHDLIVSDSIWNKYFGTEYFSGKSWFSGAYQNNTTAYHVKFNVGSHKYLIIALRYNPSSSDLLWAQGIIDANRDREVIIATHSYLDLNTLTGSGTNIWNNLVNQNKNIFLVVCGHMHPETSTSSYVIATGLNGNKVNELRVDYQDDNYGNGYMEILRFQPGKVIASAYSAYLKKTDESNAYTMEPSKFTYLADIALRASNSQYVCAEGSGGGAVVANRNAIGSWEEFELIDLSNNNVALQACNGQYLCAEGGGGGAVVANRNAVGAWETFRLIDRGNGYFALQAANGQYICAEGGGGDGMVANRNAIGAWETFRFLDLRRPANVALQAANGQYVCSESGGGGAVVANRNAIAAWETFKLIDRGNGKVALRAANGQYVCAEGGGGDGVVANRNDIGVWETFRDIYRGDGNLALQASNGQYVCAEGGGGDGMVANRNAIGAWETFKLIAL
ncbi:MAG: metallophosphoesterase [Methanothrix sp.]|nr:metallophosphoesterase [Methanothrix sp.]